MHRHSGCFYYFYSKLPSMKKLLLILFVNVIAWQTGSAQSGSDTYLTCSSLSRDHITEGIGRFEDPSDDNNPLYNYRAVMFLMNSDSKDISIWFLHSNLNLSELRKIRETKWHDQLKIIYKPRTFLSTIERAKPIHLEEKLKSFRNNKEAWMWANNLKGKVLYMLDWNDPINCVEEGDGSTIKLIQVVMDGTNERTQEIVIQPE